MGTCLERTPVLWLGTCLERTPAWWLGICLERTPVLWLGTCLERTPVLWLGTCLERTPVLWLGICLERTPVLWLGTCLERTPVLWLGTCPERTPVLWLGTCLERTPVLWLGDLSWKDACLVAGDLSLKEPCLVDLSWKEPCLVGDFSLKEVCRFSDRGFSLSGDCVVGEFSLKLPPSGDLRPEGEPQPPGCCPVTSSGCGVCRERALTSLDCVMVVPDRALADPVLRRCFSMEASVWGCIELHTIVGDLRDLGDLGDWGVEPPPVPATADCTGDRIAVNPGCPGPVPPTPVSPHWLILRWCYWQQLGSSRLCGRLRSGGAC